MATISMPMWRRGSGDSAVMFVRRKHLNEMIDRAPQPSSKLQEAVERRRRMHR